jgi:hypothetical protein
MVGGCRRRLDRETRAHSGAVMALPAGAATFPLNWVFAPSTRLRVMSYAVGYAAFVIRL